MFLRKRAVTRRENVPVAMSGVRMGERLLQIGMDDAALTVTLAGKVGLSGVAALVVENERDAERARAAAAAAGVLIDVQVSPSGALSFTSESFDLVVIQSTRGLLGSMRPERRVGSLQEAYRVLRKAGRILVIEAASRAGLMGLFRAQPVNEHYSAAGGAEGALRAEGFRPVRTLAEAEGYKFTEGLKT